MLQSPGFWLRHFAPLYVEEIELYQEAALQKVLPQFSTPDAEAEAYGRDEYARLASSPAYSEWGYGELNELAREIALDRYIHLEQIAQGMTNLLTAGLHHLVEQQTVGFCRRKVLKPSSKLPKYPRGVRDALLSHGVDLYALPQWNELDELRLVANTIKHSDGDSAADLQKRSPDLFVHPKYETIDQVRFPRPVFGPMAGSDLYVPVARFRLYVSAAQAFWYELWEQLDPSASAGS